MSSHPITRFKAPRSIQAGSSLADLFDPTAIQLIGESFALKGHPFPVETFVSEATTEAANLALKPRTMAIARVLRRHLPADDEAALACLRASFGPELPRTKDNGLQPLFYMPHSALLGGFAASTNDRTFAAALNANFDLTSRFTAEFSIRFFLESRFDQSLEALKSRITDPNPHIRRLVSEGTRPRLPWAAHLQAVRASPALTLPLLTALRDDPDRYVTRSVANHLGDIGKDHPEVLFGICREWLEDLERKGTARATSKERCWLIRHALRHPAKKGAPEALGLRKSASV
jgi:3-methyladenine DNA glycosylase AlkC